MYVCRLSGLVWAGGHVDPARCGLRVSGCPTAGCRTRVPFWDVIMTLDNYRLIIDNYDYGYHKYD